MGKLVVLAIFLLCFSVVGAASINSAQAIVPQVRSVEPYAMGPDTWLNITIYHYPQNPSSDPPHYVNILKITVDGNSTLISIDPVPDSPSADTFTWQYNLGEVSNNPEVTVTAHCLIDSWGAPSSSVTVPEFPVIAFLFPLLLALAFGAFLGDKIKHRHRGSLKAKE